MSRNSYSSTICVALTLVAGMLWLATNASALAPVKLKFTGQFGREVNMTEAGKGIEAEDVCLAAKDTCQPGTVSTLQGGFAYAYSTAVDKSTNDVYVADTANNRIEKFGPNGEFLLTWGVGVNKKGGDICKVGEECTAGSTSGASGGMYYPWSIAIDNTCFEEKLSEPTCAETDPANGHVYVLDGENHRVDEYDQEGRFILTFGGKVNKTAAEDITRSAEENVCPAATHPNDECQAGTIGTSDGFFEIWAERQGNMLSIGGSKHLLYVADEDRVQEFNHNGIYSGELSLTATTPGFPQGGQVTGVAVDHAGDVYLTESYSDGANNEEMSPKGIYEFVPGSSTAAKRIITADSTVEGLALDEGTGRLAITDGTMEGELLNLTSGAPVSEFEPPDGLSLGELHIRATGLSFNATGQLYITDPGYHDVEWYTPAVIAELKMSSEPSKDISCKPEPLAPGVLATIKCNLEGPGTVDPEGVAGTEAWYQWGPTSQVNRETPKQPIPCSCSTEGQEEPPVPIKAVVEGLAPNQSVYYELAAVDSHLEPPEQLKSEVAEFHTPTVAPRIVGQPAVSFVKPFSAVFTGEVNPENTSTEYYVEYATRSSLAGCPSGMIHEACPGVNRTPGLISSRYWTIGATLEATGLEAGTTYHYRLNATNEKRETAVNGAGTPVLPEGEFTTPLPVAPQASSTQASNVAATTAVIAGEVNPEGQQATYTFQLGVYNGIATHYAPVETGSAGNGTEPVAEQAQLSGLQPDTKYVYVIEVQTAYGTAYGAPGMFITEGLPTGVAPPNPLEMLPTPQIHFPNAAPVETRAQKLNKALHVCKLKRRNKKQRANCARKARQRYGPLPKSGRRSKVHARSHRGSRNRDRGRPRKG